MLPRLKIFNQHGDAAPSAKQFEARKVTDASQF
jgi:hypothetical protein